MTQTQEQNVPALRFPEFSGELQQKQLGNIAELTSSKRVYLTDYVDQGIPFYRGKEISELRLGIKPSDILYISEDRFEEYKERYGVPQIGDILITAVGTLGNVLKINSADKFYFKDGNLIWLRKISQNSDYLETVLQWNTRELIKTSIGSTQKALTMVELRKLNFYFPTLPEQQKIAAFLSSLDRKIAQIKQKKALLQQYKKGMMQKLFSQELRFKDKQGHNFPDWEEKRLGEVAETTTGSSNREDSTEKGKYAFFDRSSDKRASSRYLFDCEAIIVAGEGKDFPPQYFVGKFDLHQRAYATMNFGGNIGKYLFYWIHFHRYYFLKYSVGSTMPSLRMSSFSHFPVALPSPDEQQKIADFLSSIDRKIEIVSTEFNHAKAFKKGLLQQMFI